MASNTKPLRCAIYTRKSTEHGLDLEFNSLDAQREACEAYIRSQASQGWVALSQSYDDPAYSGGNLDRPALQRLLRDIDAGRVDVIVVYKIDRLTRSLADFAKLVEAFDARSISFVAVTQQFNTTTSMGRLTLNVLLSFAQFERELSSERVRDKVAASRRKGKWMGGTVPLGYDVKDKKLVINKTEAETIRYIFKRYLELQNFTKLIADFKTRGIVTKRRHTKVPKYNGGIPFTHGPLTHLLKNRVYIGESGHKGKWFKGEHAPLLDRKIFDQAQQLLKSTTIKRRTLQLKSGALLAGKLFDDRGNQMSPSFSSKNGVRYRFYVSSALLRGRRETVGSVGRVAAAGIERTVIDALRAKCPKQSKASEAELILQYVARAELSKDEITLSVLAKNWQDDQTNSPGKNRSTPATATIQIPVKTDTAPIHQNRAELAEHNNQKLIQAIVRAHHWLEVLRKETFPSVEALAASLDMHPKIIRKEIGLAFLAPDLAAQILVSGRGADLANIRAVTASSWRTQIAEIQL
jgi:site-specific DNA recombinase